MKILEVNVDDLHFGGVYSLIKTVIEKVCIKKTENCIKIDIAAIERFENPKNIAYLNSLGTKVYYIGYQGNKLKKQIICYVKLKKLIKKKSYNCVHIHADVSNKLLVSGLAAKRAGAKQVILHSHAAGVDGSHRRIKLLFHKICRRFLKYIGTDFVACSDLAMEWMFPNISHNQITIIKNGVDLDKFRFNPQVRKRERIKLGITDEILLGHVGRFAYQKNHNYLIKILKAIKDSKINAKLLLVGEGPLETQIRAEVKKEGLEEHIIFYGISTQIQDLFQAMDIFLLPSYFEGFPIVGIEAQAAGLPVLFSDSITREAKLTEFVEYLGIGEYDIEKWVYEIKRIGLKKRHDNYEQLKKEKLSIEDTIQSFLKLYR